MKKVYLVDSENVGDVWVPLLAAAKAEEEIVVFYTQRSPHMNYENVRKLKETDREAVFIKCFEGSNALDFQLVTELGYRLCREPDCEYVIVSNDTGFDAAVRYWNEKDMPVRRLSGKECYRILRSSRQQADAAVRPEETVMPEKKAGAEGTVMPEGKAGAEETVLAVKEAEAEETVLPEKSEAEKEAGRQEKSEAEKETGRQVKAEAEKEVVRPEETAIPEKKVEAEETAVPEKKAKTQKKAEKAGAPSEAEETERIVKELLSCIGKEYLADFHNALVIFFGKEKGKALYQKVKTDPEYSAYREEIPKSSQREKFGIYCHIVFSQSEYAKEEPQDFAGFLYRAADKRKNLNSLRAALTGHYGKDKGMKYYSLFKSHIKIMNRMQ